MKRILTVTPIKEETFISSNTHEEIQGKECVLLEANIGEQAWIAVKIPEDTITPWHRICTSVVKDIKEEGTCLTCLPPINQVKTYIYTENSIYCITEEH